MHYHPSSKKGFTLIEIMIVVSILAILTLMAIFTLMHNLGKSRDGKRKADLDRLKIAFEEYHVDHNTYPPGDILGQCGGDAFRPYVSQIPCDPKTQKPYCYVYDTANNGQNYRVLASLEISSDSIIADLNCDSTQEYCGFEAECSTLGYTGFNYGVSSSNIVVVSDNIGSGSIGGSTPTPTPSSTPGPLPSTNPGVYACSPVTPQNSSQCNNYGPDPAADPYFCPLSFSDSVTCNAYCPTSPTYSQCLR